MFLNVFPDGGFSYVHMLLKCYVFFSLLRRLSIEKMIHRFFAAQMFANVLSVSLPWHDNFFFRLPQITMV